MIELDDVSKRYPGASSASVDHLTLTIFPREFLVLIGPSGCGKTTTLTMINRLTEIDGGEIRIDGRAILVDDPVQLRRGIGYVIQEAGLFPHLTAAENIGITPRLLGWDRARIAARTAELMKLVQMDPARFANSLPGQLSGGQRQRVAMARALAVKPNIMLLDEPFGALDPITRDEIAEDYRRIHDELKLTTVMVTHDMTEALWLADRIAVMRGGKLVQVGTPAERAAHPADEFVARMIETPRRRTEKLAATLRGAP